MSSTIKFKKLTEFATIPTKNTNLAAGYDLYSTESFCLYSGERHLFKTNIAFHPPVGWYGQIQGRSGLAYKSGIEILGGVIDEDYRGDIGCVLLNTSDDDVLVGIGDRIAQLVLLQYGNFEIAEVTELDDSVRAGKGFGSSGN